MILKNHTFKISYINERVLSKLISTFFCTFIFTLLFYKNLSLNNTYFDLGIYYNQINYFLNGDYWIIFFGHFSPYIIFLSYLSKVINVDLLFILINCLIIYLCAEIIFKYYSLKHQIIFLFFFPIYHLILHDFHIEILVIPIVLSALILIEKGKYQISYFISLIILLLKISLYPSLISIGLFYLLKGQKKYGYSLILLSSIFLIVYYLFIRNSFIFNEYDKNLIFNGVSTVKKIIKTDIYIYINSFFIGLVSLISAKIAINYSNIKDKVFWIIISPIFFYYLLSGNINYLMPHYHYFYQFIPYLFFFSFYKKIFSKWQIIISIIFFIFFSISPFSIIYYTDIRDLYNHQSFFDQKNGSIIKKEILENINDNRSNYNISISNSIVFREYLDFKSVYPFGQEKKGYVTMPNSKKIEKFTKHKIDYFIIDKNNNYFLDKKISDDDYNELINDYKKTYNVIHDSKHILILKNEM